MTLVGLGLYLGVTAIFESLGPKSLVFPHYIARVDAELPNERAGGPFQSSVIEGFATYSCAIASAIAVTRWHNLHARALAALAGALCIFGCFVTLERGVWLGAAVATLVTALATRAGRQRVVPAAIAAVIIVAGVLALSPELSHKTSTRVSDQTSVWSRQNQTAAGLRMIAARPLFGFGWERYTSASLDYFRQPPAFPLDGYVLREGVGVAEPPLPLHDTYIAFAVELGLVGALLWLSTLVFGLGGAIARRTPPHDLRAWRLGLLAISIFYAVVASVDPHEQAFSLLLLWSWAGVAFGSPSLGTQFRRSAAQARDLPDAASLVLKTRRSPTLRERAVGW
jgi:putative inorganic carbon (hco3(-)) transporter